MKRIIYILAVIWFGNLQIVSSQSVGMRQGYNLLPQEGVYIHQNSSLLFSGERLYYKIYCIDLEKRKLSKLSKIAYVTLVDKANNPVFRHKVRLENGSGSGDFAIPAEVATGSYKLLGYTSWMQSRTERPYFETDLVLINPYKVTPKEHQVVQLPDSLKNDSIANKTAVVPNMHLAEEIAGSNLLSLSLNTDLSAPRSEIEIGISSLNTEALNGSYSLSVKQVNREFPEVPSAPMDIWTGFQKSLRPSNPATMLIPELRGELISGKVIKESSGEPAAGRQIVLSLPGESYILDISQTDELGTFYFNLDSEVGSKLAFLQLLGEDKEDYTISINTTGTQVTGERDFLSFQLDKSLEPIIVARSIHNQIENSYATVKSNTVIPTSEDLPFYRDYQQRYFLDDYTRFNTLRETMVEIIDHAWIDENNGNPRFRVRPFDGYLDTGNLEPIVTIDGLFIQDHKDVVDYNSKELRRISISRDRFVLGPKVYQGLIALETKTGEFYEVFYRGFLLSNELERPETARKYFFQQHRDEDQSERIPDFRYQLLWEPELNLNKEHKTISIYTSDIAGEFEVELKGFTSTGKPVYLKEQFTVKE